MNPRTALIIAAVLGFVFGFYVWHQSRPIDESRSLMPGDRELIQESEVEDPDAPTDESLSPPTGASDSELMGPEGPEEPRITLVGSVLDPHRNGVAGAIVWLNDPFVTTEHWVTTDGEGHYSGLMSTAGVQELWIIASGFPRQKTNVVVPDLATPAIWSAPNVILHEGGSITGSVRHEDGRPAAGVLAILREQGLATPIRFGDGSLLLGKQETLSDHAGAFQFDGVGGGRHWVRLSLDPMRPLPLCTPERFVDVEVGADLHFRLSPQATVQGILVQAGTRQALRLFRIDQTTISSEDGRFHVPIAAAQNEVRFRARGHEPLDIEIERARIGENLDLGIVLMDRSLESASLDLTVTDSFGRPVTDFTLVNESFSGGDWTESIHTNDGHFLVQGLNSGHNYFLVDAEGYEVKSKKMHLYSGRRNTWSVELRRAGRLDLSVRGSDGRVKRAVHVRIEDPEGTTIPTWIYQCEVDGLTRKHTARGGQRHLPVAVGSIHGVAAGEYQLVILRGQRGVVRKSFVIRGAGVTTLDIVVDW